MEESDRIFFQPGELVTIRQDIPNKPIMIVVGKVSSMFKNQGGRTDNSLKGIKCRWFTINQELQECTFNTKDLIKI